jgi:transcription antitermination factor NusG
MTSNWYALRVKPHKERTVYRQLREQDAIELYFPSVRVHPKNPRAAKERPYFPGYMFVRADLNNLGVNLFNWTPGTHGLVSFGDVPAVVPEHLIEEVKRRVAKIQAAGGLVFDNLQKGDRVRIVSGPLEGYEAIFDMRLPGRERVQVLLAFLSKHPQPVKMPVSNIEKAR